jgi:hypothetical protein
MKILFLEDTMWDYDFIINEILHNTSTEIEFFNRKTFKLLSKRNDIIQKNILIINKACDIHEIINTVKHIKPLIIIYTSDEIGNITQVTNLEKYTKVLLRQYNHKHYTYSENNYQIPLGYSKYYLSNKPSSSIHPKKITERELNCSFIGAFKTDRMVMKETFQKNMKNIKIEFVENYWELDKLPYKPQQCFEIYNNSIFVICGRGNSSLDCYRIYEAIVAGAIPVVVGKIDEIEIAFHYNNNIPPLIYSDTWEKAVIKCNELLNHPEQLQTIQNELLLWWKNQIKYIHEIVTHVLKNTN